MKRENLLLETGEVTPELLEDWIKESPAVQKATRELGHLPHNGNTVRDLTAQEVEEVVELLDITLHRQLPDGSKVMVTPIQDEDMAQEAENE